MTECSNLTRALDSVLSYSPLQPVFGWWASRRLAVLTYHDIADEEGFGHQIDLLKRRFRPIALEELFEAISSRRSLPPHSVLITFDDGDRSLYEVVMPVLREKGVPAVAFVVAGLVGTQTPFWWREVEELLRHGTRLDGLPDEPAECVRALKEVSNAERLSHLEAARRRCERTPKAAQLNRDELLELDAAGISIGSHTFSHPCLDQCSDATVEEEIARAHRVLEDILGVAPRAFAFPHGNWDPRAERILSNLGYEVAFLFDHRIGAFPPNSRFAISRVRVRADISQQRFRIILSGFHPFLHRTVGRR